MPSVGASPTPTERAATGRGDAPPEACSDELASIRRFYEDRFLPANEWATLRPHPYLCLRQRQRRLRDALIEHGVNSPERLRELRILDVGCGDGASLAWLVELGAAPANCTGIDLVEQRIARARRHGDAIHWKHGDVRSAELDGPFDVVLLVAVLTSVTKSDMKREIVQRCFDLLRPGGLLFFYDLMTRRPVEGTKEYKKLTYAEAESYFGSRSVRWFKRDYLRATVANTLLRRAGLPVAEAVQALGLWNIEASFARVRA